MSRLVTRASLALLTCTIFISPPARAEVTYKDENAGQEEVTVVKMTVTPAAAPSPTFRNSLLARDIDLEPGNAAPYYYRALMEVARGSDRVSKKFGDEYYIWFNTGTGAPTLAELPLEKVRQAIKELGTSINDQVAIATRRRDCDWELGIEELQGIEAISFLLPDFQECRALARVLALQTRLAVAEHRYEDAVTAMRMNYRLGHDAAQPPIIVCGLIGIAIDGMTNGTLTELIAAPDSPNMYWALTELPEPLVDMRPAARFEIDFGPRMFPFLKDAETTERAPGEWNRLLTQAIRDLKYIGSPSNAPSVAPESDVEAGVVATAISLVGYPHAKAQLIAQGMDRERVETMAVGQVLAIYTERNYRRFADDWTKLWYVPFGEMGAFEDAVDRRMAKASFFSSSYERELLPIVSLLLPAMNAARGAQVRLERQVAALRVIEALRMYAAENDGRLPESLDAIKQVPVPVNPATGKPFVYRLDGKTAVLELPLSDKVPGDGWRYEIQIAAKQK